MTNTKIFPLGGLLFQTQQAFAYRFVTAVSPGIQDGRYFVHVSTIEHNAAKYKIDIFDILK